jgi:hypothetical protein
MGYLTKAIAGLHFASVGLRQDAGRLGGAIERGRVDGAKGLTSESSREPPRLFPSFIGKWHVGGAGETILRRQDGGPMSDQENAGVRQC